MLQIKRRLKSFWESVDGPVAFIGWSGAMVFAGYIACSVQGTYERTQLYALIGSARADAMAECTRTWAENYTRQGNLLDIAVQALHDLGKQVGSVKNTTQQIADKQDKNTRARSSETKAVAKEAATAAASETVAKVESNARRQINSQVKR